jgi:hypothetical protein
VVESLVGNDQVQSLTCGGDYHAVGRLSDHGWVEQAVEIVDEDNIDAAVAGLAGRPLHVLLIGDRSDWTTASALLAERSVRPWVVVVPAGGDSLPAVPSYRHLLFDGSSDVFLADDRLELAANVASCLARSSDDEASINRWRGSALEGWHARTSKSDALRAQQELLDLKQTLSWRITRPLRAVRRRMPPAGTKT